MKNSIKVFCSFLFVVFTVSTSTLHAHSIPDDSTCDNVITISIELDDNAEEVSWTLINTGVYDRVADGEYFTELDDYEQVETSVCVSNGCYELTIYDSWGDGFSCNTNTEKIQVSTPNGNKILSSDGNFVDYINVQFCVTEDEVILANKA